MNLRSTIDVGHNIKSWYFYANVILVKGAVLWEYKVFLVKFVPWSCGLLGRLSSQPFSATGGTKHELFSYLTCLHTTTFALLSIFWPVETITKIWRKRQPSWRAEGYLRFPSVAQERRLLNLHIRWPRETYFRFTFLFSPRREAIARNTSVYEGSVDSQTTFRKVTYDSK